MTLVVFGENIRPGNTKEVKQSHATQCFKCLLFSMGEEVKWLLIVADLWLRHTTKWNFYGFSYLKRNSRWPHRHQPIQPGRVLCRLHQHIRRDDQSQDCPLSHHTKHCHIWKQLHSHLILTLLVISCRSPAKTRLKNKLHHFASRHLLPAVAYFQTTCSLLRTETQQHRLHNTKYWNTTIQKERKREQQNTDNGGNRKHKV